MTPFIELVALIAFDDGFNLTKHGFTVLADSHTQHSNGSRFMEVRKIWKVLCMEMLVGIQIAAAEDNVGGADCCCCEKVCLDCVIIILVEGGSSKDGVDLLLMLQPIGRGDFSGDLFELICQAGTRFGVKGVLQHFCNHALVLWGIVPEIRGARFGAAFGIQDIKDISDMPLTVGLIQEDNTMRTFFDVSVHDIVPNIVVGNGNSRGVLCIDQDLIQIRVFIQSRGHCQIINPFLVAAGNPQSFIIGDGFIDFKFIRQSDTSSLRVKIRNKIQLCKFGVSQDVELGDGAVGQLPQLCFLF